jgi:hypothetical protein
LSVNNNDVTAGDRLSHGSCSTNLCYLRPSLTVCFFCCVCSLFPM